VEAFWFKKKERKKKEGRKWSLEPVDHTLKIEWGGTCLCCSKFNGYSDKVHPS
jgi:hypothetical protein